MFVHETQIRVRYGETDQMGYLYYGNYAQYYEVGRTEAIRCAWKRQIIDPPVVLLHTEFMRRARGGLWKFLQFL